MSEDILERPAPPADLRIPYGAESEQFGDLRLPKGPGPHPVVLVVHGGFWRARRDLTYAGHLCTALTSLGYATWNIEYRRVGQHGGGWPGTFQDAALAADYLRALAPTYQLDLARVITIGHSAGGHLALWLGARHRIPANDQLHSELPLPLRGAIALGGVVDLSAGWRLNLGDGIVEEFMGGSPESVPERYATGSPAELVPLGFPQVLVHGVLDQPVPYVIAQEYQSRATALGDSVRLVSLEGMGHFEPVDPASAAWPLVVATVQDLVFPIAPTPLPPPLHAPRFA